MQLSNELTLVIRNVTDYCCCMVSLKMFVEQVRAKPDT